LAALSGGLVDVNPLLRFPGGRRATTSVAARQVRRHHLILVIRSPGELAGLDHVQAEPLDLCEHAV
jgi:hypothetical protein